MSRKGAPLAVWGGVLVVAAAVLWAWSGSLGPAVPLGVAGIAAVVIGAVLTVRFDSPPGDLALADQSVPVVLVALGFGIGLMSLVGGWWLGLIGGGMMLAGLGGVLRERREARREAEGPT